MKLNERFTWALSVLELRTSDHVLEIGCGTGLFAELICQQLKSGKYVAIDRSASMIKMAERRTKDFIEKGTASFITSEFLNADCPRKSFDKIIAFNVNVFNREPGQEIERVKELLKPEGRFYLFYQHPYDSNVKIIEKTTFPLIKHGFEIQDAVHERLKPYSAFCIISKPH